MPGAYRISVYNKDGSEELLASTWGDFGIVVQSDRLLWNGTDMADYNYVLFSNTNVIGYATTSNATVAEYPIGTEYTPSFGTTLTLYEVERDPYNITFSKKQLIVKCKDKTMEKDLVIKSEQPEPLLEEKTVDLSMASGNQEIIPTSGSYLRKVTITKPSTLIADNIKKDVTIGGVTGTMGSGSFDYTKYVRIAYHSSYKRFLGISITNGNSLSRNTFAYSPITFTTSTEHSATQIKAFNFSKDTLTCVKDSYVLVDIVRGVYGVGDQINTTNTNVLGIGIFLDFSCTDKNYKPAIIKHTGTNIEWVNWYSGESVWTYGAFSNSYSQYKCMCVSVLTANSALSKYGAVRDNGNTYTTLPSSTNYAIRVDEDSQITGCLVKIKDYLLSYSYTHIQSSLTSFNPQNDIKGVFDEIIEVSSN